MTFDSTKIQETQPSFHIAPPHIPVGTIPRGATKPDDRSHANKSENGKTGPEKDIYTTEWNRKLEKNDWNSLRPDPPLQKKKCPA
jgi:hypothetical protein